MSAQMEQLVSYLVDEGRELLAQPRQPAAFAYDPAADAILNDIEEYPQAFVLGCLANRMGKAKQAWKVPLRLRERFGTLDVAVLAQQTEADWARVVREPAPIHRRPDLMATVLRLGVQRLQDSYDGDAARIWEGTPPSATVVRRLLEFHGAGPKIASMAANVLIRQFKIPLRLLLCRHLRRRTGAARDDPLGVRPRGCDRRSPDLRGPRSASRVPRHLRLGALADWTRRVHPTGSALRCVPACKVLRLRGSASGVTRRCCHRSTAARASDAAPQRKKSRISRAYRH